jgi:hypothetical protein
MKQLGLFAALFIIGCAAPADTSTDTSNLSTQWNNEFRYNNVALSGTPSASNTASTRPNSYRYINDGIRGAPWDSSIASWAYWASGVQAKTYNCNYTDWWVRVDFAAPPGQSCPYNPGTQHYDCAHLISEIDLFSLQDNYSTGADPGPTTTTRYYGNVDFHLEYCPTGVVCFADGTGWREPSNGYVIGNNLAWKRITFPPVSATAVRAALNCGQVYTNAFVTELEAWEQQAAPPVPAHATVCDPATVQPPDHCAIPQDNLSWYVGDDNSSASIVADSDRFWWVYFGAAWADKTTSSSCTSDLGGVPGSNGIPDDVDGIDCWLRNNGLESVHWYYSANAVSLIRMYDLLAPVDFNRALIYLERLRQMSRAFLRERDDMRGAPADTLHGNRVMPAWGTYDYGDGTQWQTMADGAGLLTYPMAAFAKRVAAHPDWFPAEYRDDAIRFVNAVVETYTAYRSDLKWSDSTHPGGTKWTYYTNPTNGITEPYNVALSALRPMADIASAADSDLYKTSSQYNNTNYVYATVEGPYVIARSARYFMDNLKAGDPNETVAHVPWYWWRYSEFPGNGGQFPEDLNHAEITISAILLFWEDEAVLDGLLARAGYSERVSSVVTSSKLTGVANTFLGRIWYYDYSGNYQNQNVLTNRIDGPNSGVYNCDLSRCSDAEIPSTLRDYSQATCWLHQPCYPLLDGNPFGGGFAPLAKLSPWVWNRLRDSTFNPNLDKEPNLCVPDPYTLTDGVDNCTWQALNAQNHSALLLYRAYMAP